MAWDSDIGDEPQGALRDAPPEILAPIDPRAPVGGHRTPESTGAPVHEAPEHDWGRAAELVVPLLRPSGSHGTRLGEVDARQLASEGLRSHALPLVDEGPAGLLVAYAIRAGGFDVLINADHLLEWRITPDDLRSVAMTNLAAWSDGIAWTDEADGDRRLLSSDSGTGADAARILLPEVRRFLAAQLGRDGRVMAAVPERHLLVAASLRPDDAEFAGQFEEFVAAHAEGADEPIDRRVFELVGEDLRPFTL